LIGIQWCLVLVSGGRGTVVSLITAFTLAAILFPSNRRAWFRIHAAGLLAGVVIYLSLLAMNQSVVPGGEGFVSQSIGRPMAHTSGRINLWSIALDQATKQPLLGSGPSRYACGLDPNIAAHPHSFPMTVLSEMGFPAFTLLMLVCLWLGWQLLVRCRESQDGTLSSDTLIAMLGCSIMAATVHAMVSGVLIMPASQVMTILIGGWMLGTLNIQPTESPVNNRSAVLVLTISFVVAAAVSVFSVSELQKMNLRTSQERTKVLAEPRYWQMGRACNFTYDED
jgi:putative inorganic carbon (HCO3(-)) transporter